jgi:predicted  nucleic acid-binding Zn-ribbon protein
MWFGILTLITALSIAGVAAWFSIAGLMAIFSAAALPIAVMAGTLEVGKLLTASWLYRYWDETSLTLKAYLSTAVLVLMLITSMGIFGYLSKAHLDQAGVSGDAIAFVERIDGQIAREENRIGIIEDRIQSLSSSTGLDVQDSIDAQIQIRDTAWQQVQGDIDYNQGQIESVRTQLTSDLASLDNRLAALQKAVDDLRAKGTVVIETEEGGTFRRAETETIDYGAQADALSQTQQPEVDDIKAEKQRLRDQATADIKVFQDAIDRYRGQAQDTIQNANAEINKLRNQSTQSQDDTLDEIDTFNTEIDTIYGKIATLKDEKFEAEQEVRTLEKEVGPIKYVAQLLFGGDEADLLDKAVQVFILMLVFVFDPLAVMLVIAANQTLLRYGINLESKGPPLPTEPTPEEVEEQYYDSSFEEQSRELYGDNMPDILEDKEELPSAVDDAADIMSGYSSDQEFDVDINTPEHIQILENRLKKRLKQDGES